MCPHGYGDEGHGEDEFRNETATACGEIGGSAGLLFFPEVALIGIGRHIGGCEAQLVHTLAYLLDEVVQSGTVGADHALGRAYLRRAVGQVHGCAVHDVHLVQRPLGTRRTGAAKHTFNAETQYF